MCIIRSVSTVYKNGACLHGMTKKVLDKYSSSETIQPHHRLFKRYFTKAKKSKLSELNPKSKD